jgi:hypothetical protein
VEGELTPQITNVMDYVRVIPDPNERRVILSGKEYSRQHRWILFEVS